MLSNRHTARAFILALAISLSPLIAFSQNISIPGITGVDFDTTGGSYTIAFTQDFTVHGISITASGLSLSYNADNETLSLYGSASASFDGESVDLGFGDSDNPGLVITNGALTEVILAVSSNFSMRSLSLAPDGLGFSWTGGSSFGMFGGVTATVGGDDITAAMGELSEPGILIENGNIVRIRMSVTTDFEIKSLNISPEELTFEYSETDNRYQIYGNVSTSFDNETIDGALGDDENPGFLIQNGNLIRFNIGVTADFSVKGLTISPDGMTFEYDSGSDHFEMFGSVLVKFDGEEIDATFGDADDPGLVIVNGTITHVNFGLTADFEIKSLAVIPDNLTFEYDSGNNHYEMYGNLTFKIGDDELEAIMGDADNPGLIYKNNSIQQINIGITSDFSVSGLKVKTTDLGAEWLSGSDYHIYGDADLSIANETVDVDFGTFSEPGIVVKNGNLHAFEVDVNSDLKLGNLEVETKDLDIKYQSSKFEVTGEMEITEVFSLSVTLGEGSQGGLEIDVSGGEPRFKVEALEIDIEHANLGAIDLKKFDLKFNSSGIEESDVKVVFPQGWEVDAILKFTGNPARLNSIEIDYIATNLAEAITIFEGVQLALLSASVDNLTRPSDLKVSGAIETIYGGGFSLAGHSATFLQMRDEVTITPRSFDLKGDVNVGAYRTGSDSWHALLGSGDIDLFAYFGHYVRARADVKIPGSPLIEADATVYLDNHGHFDALLDVEFIVPHWVPFIGGKHYGSVDGAVRYNKSSLNSSYGAAWVSYKIFWHRHYTGARYSFGDRKVKVIGKGTINGIKSTINREIGKAVSGANVTPVISTVHTFTISDPPPNAMLIDIDWVEPVDSALVTVIGPEGIYELTKAIIVEENDTTTTPTFGYEENMTSIAGDTTTAFIFTTPAAFSEEEIIHARMIPGRYQMAVSFQGDSTSMDTVQFLPMWQEPEVSIEVNQNENNQFELSADYWSSLPDSTYIAFYVGGVGDSNEVKILEHVLISDPDEEGFGTEELAFTADFVDRLDTLHFYSVIDDGVNPPVVSDTSTSYVYEPDVSGSLTFPAGADSLAEGLRVFIDQDKDGSFDVESTGGLELFALTNELGYFAITGLLPDETYELRIVLPPGYRLTGGTDRFTAQVFVFDGTPVEFDLTIEAYTEED
ncbi:MAG: hypothetical protein AAFW89_05100 [Bacteroidota bacterium]